MDNNNNNNNFNYNYNFKITKSDNILNYNEIYLLIATPCFNSQVTSSYTESLINTCLFLTYSNIKFDIKFLNNQIVTRARNLLAHMFMNDKPNYTHMIFIDADIIWKPQDVMNLLEHNLECVIGMYPNKNYHVNKNEKDIKFNIFSSSQICKPLKIKENNENLIKIDFAATGFMMLKKTALKKIEKDIEKFNFPKNNQIEKVYNYFDCNVVNSEYLTEDYYFSLLLNKNGGEIYADKRITLLHTGVHNYGSLINIYLNNDI